MTDKPNPTCATCRWWEKLPRQPKRTFDIGACHRHPPQTTSVGIKCYPLTSRADWCGDHAPHTRTPTDDSHID